MTDFEMKNFHDFPVEKISYDLKLELLEELGSEEGLELMKVNKGFRSIYLKDPWRIIGRHVDLVAIRDDTIQICKLRQSGLLSCDLHLHLALLKKIKRCQLFYYSGPERTREEIDIARKMLSNLDSIGVWGCWIEDLESFKECFSNFEGQITDLICMHLEWYSGQVNDPNLSLVSKAFETQLGKCKKVTVSGRVDQFSIVSKLFSKTRVQRIFYRFICEQFSATGLEMAMRWIVCNGIPSQNRKAGISIEVRTYGNQQKQLSIADAYHFLDDFLSTFPGMQQMPDEKDIRSYWRKIDDERDCIYEFGGNEPCIFTAKYVPSSQAE